MALAHPQVAFVEGRSNVMVEYPGTGDGVISLVGAHMVRRHPPPPCGRALLQTLVNFPHGAGEMRVLVQRQPKIK